MRPVHILCARPMTERQLATLRAVSPRLAITVEPAADRDAFTRSLRPETEVLYGPPPPTSLAHAPGLRWVQVTGAGANLLIGTPVWEANIAITTTSGIHATTIGEWTLGAMLALARKFPLMFDHQRRAAWPPDAQQRFLGPELRGATVVVVGYGSIGREVGRLAYGLGMRVLAVKRDPGRRADAGYTLPGTGDPAGAIPESFHAIEELRAVLPRADWVVLTVPLTDATRGLIGAAELAALPAHARLINVARGVVVDQGALIAALRDGRLAGAALDVTDPEPLPPDNPLWSLENVIVSPHIAGFTPRYYDYAADLFAENLRRYLADAPLLNVVDRRRGY